MIFALGLAAVAVSLAFSALATPMTRQLAFRLNMLDMPGRHKTHARAVPLLGGSAIFAAVLVPSLLGMALASVWSARGVPPWVPSALAVHVAGAAAKAPLALGILAGAFLLHVLGLIDDARALGPWPKLIAQVLVAAAVVLGLDLRILTALGPALSSLCTILWLVGITNAFNFLDNMDGLAAGVAAICAAALLGAAAQMGQLFVAAWLCLILGAVLGFLPYNFPPASTFMGDAGSMVIGFLLASVSCLTTYVPPGATYYLYGVFVPVVLMAVPLYDMVSVIVLRVRLRHNPMVGDQRHFSHRLARRGMGTRTVVLTIYLCTAATAIAASLLAHVKDNIGAVLVFLQTLAVLLIIALLESGKGKS